MNSFTKIVRPGRTDHGNVFVKIEYTLSDNKGRLSISGVEGPKRNGDCSGGCGQIIDTVRKLSVWADGWHELAPQLVSVWERWHLNDMNPGCEHQRTIDTTKRVEVVSYKLTHEAYRQREKVRELLANAALKGEIPTLSPTDRALAGLDKWFENIHTPPDADSPLSGCYEVAKRETKGIGWVYPHEHPEGILCKPCEMCGYKYGSQWLYEPVPEDVLEWLKALPDTDVTPAWC